MAMSDTRPPITAGPIERAFRFLKSASLSAGGDGEGLSVAEGDGASCADKIEMAQVENQNAQKHTTRVVMRRLPSRCTIVGQARRLLWGAHAPRVLISAPSPKSQRMFIGCFQLPIADAHGAPDHPAPAGVNRAFSAWMFSDYVLGGVAPGSQ